MRTMTMGLVLGLVGRVSTHQIDSDGIGGRPLRTLLETAAVKHAHVPDTCSLTRTEARKLSLSLSLSHSLSLSLICQYPGPDRGHRGPVRGPVRCGPRSICSHLQAVAIAGHTTAANGLLGAQVLETPGQ